MVAESAAAGLAGDLVVVPDPQQALGRLAGAWRARFDLPLAIVVGSNGKTTVKEMITAALAARHGAGAVLATIGNLNNAIGLPLTLLRLRETHRAAVIELGMNHRGETAELAAIAKPTIAVVNNAQREHQEFMSNVAEVAAEHADAILALPAGGVAVINADDPHAGVWREAAARAGARVVGFGTGAGADVRGEVALAAAGSTLQVATAAGQTTIALAVPGLPMAQNALAAVRRRTRGRRGSRVDPARPRGVPRRAPGDSRRASFADRRGGDRRHLQRQSGLGARGDRRARARREPAHPRARRHGRGRRRGPGIPPRGRRLRPRRRDRPALRDRRAGRARRGRFRPGRAPLRAGRRPRRDARRRGDATARRCWSRARASCAWNASSPR